MHYPNLGVQLVYAIPGVVGEGLSPSQRGQGEVGTTVGRGETVTLEHW